jgi:acetyl-CoA synthetase
MHKQIYDVPAEFAARARFRKDDYQRMYRESVSDPEGFWARTGQRIDWIRPYSKVRDVSFDAKDFRIRWFYDGQLNVSYNCLDRHLAARGDKTAILWEGDNPAESESITYRELYYKVCKLANALKSLGVQKGDRVTIYLPMIPEAAVAMLACSRIGAIHSVVFGGFSPDSLAGRIADCASTVVITADEGLRGGKKVPLKANVDQALSSPGTETVKHVLVVKRTSAQVAMYGRDQWYHEVVDGQPENCEPATGVGVSCTTVPAPKFDAHVAPQLIPAGALVTPPLPVPALLTVSA